MTLSPAETEVAPLLLTEAQVPVNAVVYLIDPGTSKPAELDGEPLPPLRRMRNGVPQRLKLYEVGEDGRTPVPASGYEGFAEGVRFTPGETYSRDEAPVATTFAVFVDGVRMLHEERKTQSGPDWQFFVEVYKSVDGVFIDSNHFYGRFMEIPPEALLVPTSVVGEAGDPTRPARRR